MSTFAVLLFVLLACDIEARPPEKFPPRQNCGKRFLGDLSVRDSTWYDFFKRVVGGKQSEQGAWPWQVALLFNGRQMCGGSLINEKWVVSARHCFHERWSSTNPANWSASLGEHHLKDKEGFEQFIPVKRIVLHELNNLDELLKLPPGVAPPDYDLALLELAHPAELDKNVFPICLLPPGKKTLTSDKECYVTGWGKIQFEGDKPDVIREARVQIVPNEICNQEKSYNGSIHGRAICAGFKEGGVDACQYDSGGPLSCKLGSNFYLTGVVSWGHGCGQPHKYGVYANMMKMTSWVRETIAKLEKENKDKKIRQ